MRSRIVDFGRVCTYPYSFLDAGVLNWTGELNDFQLQGSIVRLHFLTSTAPSLSEGGVKFSNFAAFPSVNFEVIRYLRMVVLEEMRRLYSVSL